MSSTNRANAAERKVADYYVTPIPSIREFMEAFNEDITDLASSLDESEASGILNPIDVFSPSFTILDPCAGGDKENEMSYPAAIERYSGWNYITNGIDTIDIREDSRAQFKEDYLRKNLGDDKPYDMAITNPPFNIAIDVIQKCLKEVQPGGWVIMLLRLNFFGSQERSAWFKKNMPVACYVHSKRMRFRNTGGTDSIEYMHACWCVGQYPKFAKLRVL